MTFTVSFYRKLIGSGLRRLRPPFSTSFLAMPNDVAEIGAIGKTGLHPFPPAKMHP